MAIVTFWNGTREQCGNTASSLALATQMSIERNMKILLISTSLNDYSFKDSFWYEKKKKMSGIFGPNTSFVVQKGVEGLDRIIRSNKITPEIITDYTKIVLKDRLELLLGVEGSQAQYEEIKQRYPQIILLADKYYDLVIVDLATSLETTVQDEILKNSDTIVAMIPQKIKEIQNILEKIKKGVYVRKDNSILTIGKYNEKTKYNAKNISRNILMQKEIINTIPYNTLFFEAMQEGKLIDLFLNFLRLKDTDENYKFVSEIKRLSESVKEKIRISPRRRGT